MRLRRFLARLVPGAVAAGVLAICATASLGQSASGNGAIEIVGVASTAAIANVTQQLVLTVPSGYAANRRSAGPSADGLASRSYSNTGDVDLIASVVQISGSIVDLPVGSAGNDNPTKRREPGKNLVLVQFN